MRVLSQGADATLQVAMASYILFSPQAQPDASSIAAVLALTLLPFSVVGPFVGVVLDRVPRRTVAMVVDSVRAAVAVSVALLVLSGPVGGAKTVALYAALLLAMSLSRFLLAGLAAALPSVVDPEDYFEANSVMPVVGPLGAVVAGAAVGIRAAVSAAFALPAAAGDALLFALSGALFLASVATVSRFSARGLGPEPGQPRSSLRDSAAGVVAAVAELRHQQLTGRAAVALGSQRVVFGLIQVATILVFRNRLHDADHVGAALGDIALWAGLTGAGYLVASVLAAPWFERWGLRRGIVAVLVLNAVVQVFPGCWWAPAPLWIAAFGLGLCGQLLKIAVDTLTQRSVDDAIKGRVFVLYDIVFNVALVLAAGIGAVILPRDGASLPVFAGAAAAYMAIALWFARASAPPAASGGARRE